MITDFEIKILLSLLSLGFFGGFSHCGFMCGPFVLMQVNSNLKDIKINDLTYFKKLKGLALIPYHLGRITTYSFLGFLSAFVGKNIRDNTNVHFVSAFILLLGSLLIFNLILKNLKINLWPNIFQKKVNLHFKSISIFKNILSVLFKNPRGRNGYLLGIILGFIPCGLLYSAIVISATLDNYFLGAFGMLIFGIATIPTLFISAIGGYLFFDNMKFGFRLFSQFILLINTIILFIMALSQIKLI